MTEDEMIGWHHQLDGHEFEQAPGVGDGQGSLVCCSPWGCKQSDTTERLNWTEKYMPFSYFKKHEILRHKSKKYIQRIGVLKRLQNAGKKNSNLA